MRWLLKAGVDASRITRHVARHMHIATSL